MILNNNIKESEWYDVSDFSCDDGEVMLEYCDW